jgi:hypothetical protein
MALASFRLSHCLGLPGLRRIYGGPSSKPRNRTRWGTNC